MKSGRTVVFFLVVSVVFSCGDDRPLASRPHSEAAGRVIETAEWDTVLVLGGSVSDTVLFLPRKFAADNSHLYVFDTGDDALKSFNSRGELEWRFGSTGAGPTEFKAVIDLEMGPNGNIWLLDGGLGRISIISPAGELLDQFLLGDELVRDILPLPRNVLGTAFTPADYFVISLDVEGNVLDREPLPIPELKEAYYSARQTFAAVSAEGDESWVAVFPLGDTFVVYRGQDLRCSGKLVEGGPFPTGPTESDERRIWAAAVALGDRTVYVLPKGETEDAFKVLDRYSSDDCRYLGSLRLPRAFNTMYLEDDVFFLEFEDPFPTILGLRQHGASN
jgi:hypothetical protein